MSPVNCLPLLMNIKEYFVAIGFSDANLICPCVKILEKELQFSLDVDKKAIKFRKAYLQD